MKTKTLSPRERRQRKFFLVLPAIVLPFTTLLFLSLGGGTVDVANAWVHPGKGLNSELPKARLKDNRGLTKMSYYDQVASDSARIRQQLKRDPYHHGADAGNLRFSVRPQEHWNPKNGGSYVSGLTGDRPDAKADEVYKRLAQLQTAISKSPQGGKPNADHSSADIALADKLQKDIAPSKEDPELTQMSGLLEKILDIQHPDRVIPKVNAQASATENNPFQAISAAIDGKQKITDGTVVRIKLLDTVTINGQFIPKGQLLFGSGQLYNQRLTMTIKLIRMGNNILPVDLTVFDMTDGLEGICVPEAITGDAVRDGAANGVQGLELMSFDPSVGTQLAGAGINAAKGLFSRKVKRIKAKLQDGHRLLLRDNKKIRELQKQARLDSRNVTIQRPVR